MISSDYYNDSKGSRFCRLSLVQELYNEDLCLDKLLKNGLNAAPQGPQRVGPQLKTYLDTIFVKN